LLSLNSGQVTENKKIGTNTADAFARLYEEHFTKVYRYISYQIDDTAIVEDLTSCVFEKALTKFHSYDAGKAAFSTWVMSIARNTVMDHYRMNRKELNMKIENIRSAVPDDPSPDEAMVKDEEISLLRSYLSKMSKQEQDIISFKFGAEMTNRQIAKTLGLSESNVAVIIFRAVRKLRDQYRGVTA
jgi:RNA polymerase sigma factor (sigma-70 family)